MHVHSAAASVARIRAIKGAILTAAVVAALVAMPAATFAKGGGGGSGATNSWIAVASVSGAAGTVPVLGSSVSFSTGYPSNVQNPRIEVLCYQNGSLVYGEAGATTDTFLLGGGGSIWLSTGGGATCTANLFYFGSHAGSQTYNLLATTGFTAN